jgi:hypothetical protein
LAASIIPSVDCGCRPTIIAGCPRVDNPASD